MPNFDLNSIDIPRASPGNEPGGQANLYHAFPCHRVPARFQSRQLKPPRDHYPIYSLLNSPVTPSPVRF